MLRPHSRHLSRWSALALAFASLASTGSAQLLSSASAATPENGASSTASKTATTPSVPVPASAKAQNGLDASSTATPSNAGGTGAPATSGAATGTTTYVPSGGAATTPSTATSVPTATVPTVTSATAVIARTPAPTKAKNGDRPLSTGAILIAILAALLILACVAWALARQRAFEPHWLLSLRHAMAEAGYRASATWAEFTDWARLGH